MQSFMILSSMLVFWLTYDVIDNIVLILMASYAPRVLLSSKITFEIGVSQRLMYISTGVTMPLCKSPKLCVIVKVNCVHDLTIRLEAS